MILGILSDTHGEGLRTRAAISVLQRAGAETFVHCGDMGDESVLDELVGLDIHIVCGNIDCPNTPLARYAAALGLEFGLHGPRRFTWSGRTVLAFHGHESLCQQLLADSPAGEACRAQYGACDYLLHGHTHIARDVRLGSLRIINPGALHRARVYTVATLDLESGAVRFWEISDGAADRPPRQYHPSGARPLVDW